MLEFINKYILGATVPCALMATGIYFWIRLKLFPITKLPQVAKSLTRNGKSSLRALALSLAGTLGVGNIAGVATALCLGGAGAMLWMWISAAVAAVLKYAEIVLAMLYREPSPTGYRGGAPYYIRATVSLRAPFFGRLLAALFALLCIVNCISMGAVIQTGAVSEALDGALNIPPVICGVALALLTFRLMRGGAERTTRLTSALVPFMSVFYVVLSLAVIIPRAHRLPQLFRSIFADAFSIESATGGFLGFLLSRSLRFGVMRGLFSNEAGCGTSPTAHIGSGSTPCEQGFMGIVEVLVDTILLCSMTGFSLLLVDAPISADAPIGSVLSAFSSAFPPRWAVLIEAAMALMIFCFGFATVSCMSHYALECVGFLSKRGLAGRLFIPTYSFFVFLGAVAGGSGGWAVSDATVGIMTLINLAVLVLSRREIVAETEKHFKKPKKQTAERKN